MKKILTLSAISLAALIPLASCQLSGSPVQNKAIESSEMNMYELRGTVEFPGQEFTTKAAIADIAPYATVSIIVPPDSDAGTTDDNATVATGLTDLNGNFVINPSAGFSPSIGDTFILEASKRIGGVTNSVMTLRTILEWSGSGWHSITSPGVYINTKTTAVSIMQGHMLFESYYAINSIDTSGPTSVVNDICPIMPCDTPIATADEILEVADLVTQVLGDNYDPVQHISYQNDVFVYNAPTGAAGGIGKD